MSNRQRIAIRLASDPGTRYATEALTCGVPFADGDLATRTSFRCVAADGRALPLQTAEVTTWKPDLRHVKWLLADFQADPVRDGDTVWLERIDQPDGRETWQEPAIAITQSDGLITIDTGRLRLTLRSSFPRWERRQHDSPFVACEVLRSDGTWQQTLRDEGLLLYMTDQHGGVYTSLGGIPAPRVTIEERGPLRVCVLICGHHMSAQGQRFCPYRLRLHFYAGRSDIRLFHTFIYDQDPTRIELKSIGIRVLLHRVAGAQCALGGVPASGGDGPLSLLQRDDLRFDASSAGARASTGGKAPGWAAVTGPAGGAFASIRDFWQEYPKGFSVAHDAIDVRIWPDDAPHPLRFLTPFDEPPIYFHGVRDEATVRRLLAERPTAPLALKSFQIRNLEELAWVEEMIGRLAPDRAASYCDFMGVDTGIGAAKTTEVVLRFTADSATPDDAAAFAATAQQPLVAVVDPVHVSGTRALGHFLPAGHPLFVDIDRNLDEQFEKTLPEPVRLGRLYGMLEHGQMRNGHTMAGGPPSGDLVYHHYKQTDPQRAFRHLGPFNNESLDHALGVWGQFLRTGRREDLRQAQVTARAIADVSFIHATPDDPDRIGCIHYHGAHVWSAGPSRSHSETGFMLAGYYLTGDRRLRETALEAADGIVDNKLEPCGIINCLSRLFREFTGPLAVLMDAYQLTWHEKYGTPAQRSLNWFLRSSRTPGWLPGSIYTGGPRGAAAVVEPEGMLQQGSTNTYHIFEPAFRLFPSKELDDFLLAYAERACRTGLNEAGASICLAYDLTEKPAYAAAALAKVRAHCLPHPPERVVCFYDIIATDFAPRLMSIVARAHAKDPAGFLTFAERWALTEMDATRAPFPRSDPQPPRVDLGVLSTEPLSSGGSGRGSA